MPRVDEIFAVRYGHSLQLNRLRQVEPPDGVNFIGRAMHHNGVTARVVPPADVALGMAGELTVALNGNGVLSTFVQPEPFVTAFHVAILAPLDNEMSLSAKLWWARCILANRYRFSYGRQANRSLSTLELPAEVPRFVAESILPDFTAAKGAAGEATSLPNPSRWGRWDLGELFELRKGHRITKRRREKGPTPFVGAAMRNNGITDWFRGEPEFPSGAITVPYNGNGV